MQPKYELTGNTIEEMARNFAELVIRTQRVEVVEKDKTKFAAWRLDDGTSDSFYKSLALTPEEAAVLEIKGESPLKLAIDVRFLSLTPTKDVEKAQKAAKAATIQRIEKRLGETDSLRQRLQKLQGK